MVASKISWASKSVSFTEDIDKMRHTQWLIGSSGSQGWNSRRTGLDGGGMDGCQSPFFFYREAFVVERGTFIEKFIAIWGWLNRLPFFMYPISSVFWPFLEPFFWGTQRQANVHSSLPDVILRTWSDGFHFKSWKPSARLGTANNFSLQVCVHFRGIKGSVICIWAQKPITNWCQRGRLDVNLGWGC